MKLFLDLGERIAARWSGDHGDFAEVATAALQESSPHGHVTADEIVDWAMTTGDLPLQADLDASFGQPPVTLFAHDRFVVTALFWVDGTTSIHQHAFSGAFQVLVGSSLHTPFAMEQRRALTERLAVGVLRAGASELLNAGDVRVIHAGRELIHSLFHLDRPSVTILARTRHDPGVERQFAYLPPCVAFDPFERDPTLKRRQQLLGMLFALDPDRFRATAAAFLAHADVEATFHVLRQARKIDNDTTFSRLLSAARARHGEVVDALVPAIDEERRRVEIAELRDRVVDADLRYFLALLLNTTRRDAVLALTRARVPDAPPEETVVAWIRRLGAVRFAVQAGPASFEVSAVRIPIDESTLTAARLLLDGVAPETIASRVAAADVDRVTAAVRALRGLALFAPLFAG